MFKVICMIAPLMTSPAIRAEMKLGALVRPPVNIWPAGAPFMSAKHRPRASSAAFRLWPRENYSLAALSNLSDPRSVRLAPGKAASAEENGMTESVTYPRERLAIGRLLLLPFILVALPVTASTAALCETSFRGKTITMLVGSQAGSGTDATGRAVARVLGKYLPGTPTVVVQNMPGANGVTAMNYFMLRTKPDGLTVFMGANSIVDPLTYRRANAQYDPTTIRIVGGIGRGGTLVFISREAEKRLTDKSAAPVMIGNQGALPNPGMMPV